MVDNNSDTINKANMTGKTYCYKVGKTIYFHHEVCKVHKCIHCFSGYCLNVNNEECLKEKEH